MKSLIQTLLLTVALLSVNTTLASALENPPQPPTDLNLSDVNTTLPNPPQTPTLDENQTDTNTTLVQPPEPPALDENQTDTNTTVATCNYNEYKSPLTQQCTSINPVTVSDLTTGVWLDVVVDKVGRYSGCHEFSSTASNDLTLTSYYKDENNQNITENPYINYDDSRGELSIENSKPITSMEILYLTHEIGTGYDVNFMVRDDPYSNNLVIDGLTEHNATATTCSDFTNLIDYKNDYFNPNLDKKIQISGHITLPDEIDAGSISVQAVTADWQWISQSSLDKGDNNLFTLGFDTAQNVAIELNFSDANDWYEFYLQNDGTWKQKVAYNSDITERLITVDANKTDLDLNVTALFASLVKVTGTVAHEADTTIGIQFLDVSNGQYFGWQQLENLDVNFSAKLPSVDVGSKFLMQVTLNSPNRWESYFVDLRDSANPKLVPDTNTEWNAYVKNSDGTITPVVNDGTYSANQIWLPNLEKTGFLELKDENNDGVSDAIAPISLSFLNSALDEQFYIIEGNVTVPVAFVAGTTNNSINFDITDADSGEWLASREIQTTDLGTSTLTNVYKYKIKIDRPESNATKNLAIRVNYNFQDNGLSQYNGYYLLDDGNLTSDRKIQNRPVLKDKDGNTLVPNTKASDECFNSGDFWWQEENTTGSCYDDYPSRWVPVLSSTQLFKLNGKRVVNLDFNALANETYKLEGEIVVPSGFTPNLDFKDHKMIRVEAINAITGEYLGDAPISVEPVAGKTNTYKYSMLLEGVSAKDEIIVRLVKEQSTEDSYNYESYYLVFNDNNTSNVSLQKENSVQWNENSSGFWVPDVSGLTLGADKAIVINLDYETIIATYNANKLSFSGEITLSESIYLGDAESSSFIRVDVLNANNGEYLSSSDAKCVNGSTSCDVLSYSVDLPRDGNYTLRLSKQIDNSYEEFYFNPGANHDANSSDTSNDADKIVNAQNIPWVEANEFPSYGGKQKNWMPNPLETGWFDTTSAAQRQTVADFDFTAFENSQYRLEGTITVAYDFKVGSFCTDGSTTTLKRCEWEDSSNIGYNEFYGSKNLSIEVVDKDSGKFVGHVDLSSKEQNTNNYKFKLILGDSGEAKNYIVKISKSQSLGSQWKNDDIFYDFGTNHTFEGIDSSSDGEKLVNGKKVPFVEVVNSQNLYNSWIPDSNQTGYISFTSSASSVTNFNADISQFGLNDVKLKGKVTFKSAFDLSSQSNYANISAIDTDSGLFVANAPINSDGSYELDLGEDIDKTYILQINYSHYDYADWKNSWNKNKFYDFGSDNLYSTDDTVLNDSEVRWVPKLDTPIAGVIEDSKCWSGGNFWDYDAGTNAKCYPQPNAFVPNVNGISLTQTTTGVDLDLSVVTGHTIGVNFTNLSVDATNRYVILVNPTSNVNVFEDFEGNSTSLSEIKNGDYTLEFGYELNGEPKHFFIKDDNIAGLSSVSAVSADEVRWTNISGNYWGPNSADTTYANISQDVNISITIPTVVSHELNVTLTGLETNKKISANLQSVEKPYGNWREKTSESGTIAFNFSDLKNDNYFLSFNYDGNEYFLNSEDNGSKTLKKDPEWIAKDSTGVLVCGGSIGYDCSWDNSSNWIWQPDVKPLAISASTNTFTLALPARVKVTGDVDLSSDFAGKKVSFSIFQNGGNDWNSKEYTLDANGDANMSLTINGGDGYRVETWIGGLGGYVYDNNGTGNSWINSNKSYDTTTWQAKASTLFNMATTTSLVPLSVGSNFKQVTISMQNLETSNGVINEDVWISLEGGESYYGFGNANYDEYPVTYDSNITFKVPTGYYKIAIFPMSHKAGYLNDSSGVTNTISSPSGSYSEISWNETDSFTISANTSFTVLFPTLASLKEINGTVICKDTTTDNVDNNDVGSDCQGWMDAWNGSSGKGTIVNSDGAFNIKGLDAGNYELNYISFSSSLNGLTLRGEANATSANVQDIIVKKDATKTIESITGTVTTSETSAYYVVLIKSDGTDWEVISNVIPDSSGNFTFGSMPKPVGKSLIVTTAGRTFNNDGSSSVKFDTNGAVEVYNAGNIAIPNLGTDLGTYTISATAN